MAVSVSPPDKFCAVDVACICQDGDVNSIDIEHQVCVCLGEGIACFKCVSVNRSNPACEDPFHNNYTMDLLERPCMGGRKGRNGLFPAASCIKLGGRYGQYKQGFPLDKSQASSPSFSGPAIARTHPKNLKVTNRRRYFLPWVNGHYSS